MEGDVQNTEDREKSVITSQSSSSTSSPSSSPVIILEHVLRPVAMVNVPVKDEDSQRCTMGNFLCVASGECGCVEETEAAGIISLCVMTGRTNDRHAIIHLETREVT